MATVRDILEKSGAFEMGTVYRDELYVDYGGITRIDLLTGRAIRQDYAGMPFRELSFRDLCETLGMPGVELIENFTFYKQFGLLPELEDFVRDYAYIKHESYVTQAALMALSTIAAPYYYSPFRKGKLNEFHLMIGYSNCGKSSYIAAIEEIVSVAMRGADILMGEPQSPEGLHASLVERNFGIISLPEGEKILTARPGDAQAGVLKVLMSCWASNERIVARRTKQTDNSLPTVKCALPTAVLQMVPNDFESALMNKDVIHGGLLARCSWGYSEDEQAKDKRKTLQEIPEHIKQRLLKIATPVWNAVENIRITNETRSPKEPPYTLQMKREKCVKYNDESAEKYFEDIVDDYTLKSDALRLKGYHALSSILGRMPEKIMRHACLSAIWAHEGVDPAVTREDMEKARDFEECCLAKFEDLFKIYEKSNEHERVAENIDRWVEKEGGEVLINFLRTRVRCSDKSMLDTVIRQKVNDGTLEYGAHGRAKTVKKIANSSQKGEGNEQQRKN
jgi:hypothetical protein